MDTRTAILSAASALFARDGYDKVSMRDIANAVGIRAPALYNHFKDKESLYLESVAHAFQGTSQALAQALSGGGSAPERLERYVLCLARLFTEDPDSRRLIQREILDGNDARLRTLADQVFMAPFSNAMALSKELAPQCDVHLMTVSIAALVLHHIDTRPLRRLLPGYRSEHEAPERIARHVCSLLLDGISSAADALEANGEIPTLPVDHHPSQSSKT